MIWFSVIGFTDPNIMKKLQVDRGAILIISCESVEILFLQYIFLICRAECSQAIMAEGKEHALAIGFTKMSAKDM